MPPSKNLPAAAGAEGSGNNAEGSSQEEPRTGRSIWVRSVSDKGRRRAGIAFGPEPQRVWLEDLTEDQQEAIGTDTHLIARLHDDD